MWIGREGGRDGRGEQDMIDMMGQLGMWGCEDCEVRVVKGRSVRCVVVCGVVR